MKSFDRTSIQVNLTGPGSQPAEEDDSGLEFIRLPQEMDRYCAPDLPEPETVAQLAAARTVMDWLQAALERYRVGDPPQVADISGLDAANRDLVNQILGEGEVSLQYNGSVQARMQESVLAGIWRTCYLDERGVLTHDLIEVADVPLLARTPLAGDCDPGRIAGLTDAIPPAEVMNAMPILSEVQEHLQTWQPGQTAHVINLSLLPLSPADIEFLEQTLGEGPVQTLSRGYGECQVRSTACPNLWWVRYYNSMGTLILNTLEVVDIPLVACAAQDDLDDSRRRMQELLEPYWQELA
jgi:hydrogenase-1 operon protein HyaF